MNKEKPKIQYGDDVIVLQGANSLFEAGTVGSVCGIYEVETQAVADKRGCSIGDIYYLIEVGDGTSEELHQQFVRFVE